MVPGSRHFNRLARRADDNPWEVARVPESIRYKNLASLRILCALCASAVPAAAQSRGPDLRTYETRYYTLHTDLAADDVREAALRITLMAEEYYHRTEGLAGAVRERLPFYLFRDRKDYAACGGRPGTAGVFTGTLLMAVADAKNPDATWHAVQHEGFHQFVLAAIGPRLPMWANEGLAEYFGHGVFTGDEFIVGLIPPARLARLKAALKDDQLRPLHDMLVMSAEAWNGALTAANYDEAWSMVHFLAHAGGGRYQQAFIGFLRDVSHKAGWEQAWLANLGGDVDAFENRWREYWTRLPDDPTADLYAQAVVSTLTGFLARSFSQRQYFQEADEFFAAARTGQLKAHHEDWLPPRLLDEALAAAPYVGQWSLVRKTGQRALVCSTPTGTVLEGTFRVDGSRVKSVGVNVAEAGAPARGPGGTK
jgi:hypothetical protein